MTKKVFLVMIISLLIVLTWAPWLSASEAKEIVLSRHPEIGNRFLSDPGCGEVHVNSLPLSKWVNDCEGGYIVTSWGGIIGE